jgi:hypothetical protein
MRMGLDGYYGLEAPNMWLLVKAIQELKAANDDLVERMRADPQHCPSVPPLRPPKNRPQDSFCCLTAD